jgi:hypothetical protein
MAYFPDVRFHSSFSFPLSISLHFIALANAPIYLFELLNAESVPFSDQVAIVWKSRWTLVKVIFVLNRYVTPATLAVNMWSQ